MKIRRLLLATALLSASFAAASAHAEDGYPWIVVYAEQRCALAESINPELTLKNLLGMHGCVKEEEIFNSDDVLSVGCEESLGTGFVLARTQQQCEVALEVVLEAAAQPAE